MTPIYYVQFRCPTTGRLVRDGAIRPMSRTDFDDWRGTRQLYRVGCACRDGAHFLGTQDYALEGDDPPSA